MSFTLEEAILDVLLAAKHEGDCIGAADISRRTGIFRERGHENIINDAIVTGMLVKLSDENKVKRCQQENNRGGWELIDMEFEKRRDDLRL